jgi:hypothetical protein
LRSAIQSICPSLYRYKVNSKANFETSFSLYRPQELKPVAYKLWVGWIQLVQPHIAIGGVRVFAAVSFMARALVQPEFARLRRRRFLRTRRTRRTPLDIVITAASTTTLFSLMFAVGVSRRNVSTPVASPATAVFLFTLGGSTEVHPRVGLRPPFRSGAS